MKKFLFVVALLATMTGAAVAQDYKNSIGVIAGMTNGVSYKHFVGNKLAIQADLGFGINYAPFSAGYMSLIMNCWDFSINPNVVYQSTVTGNLSGYLGGGLTLGEVNNYGYNTCIGGKFGINAVMGLEYKLPAPLTLAFDFRPGYGLFFDSYEGISTFDWKLTLSLRYLL